MNNTELITCLQGSALGNLAKLLSNKNTNFFIQYTPDLSERSCEYQKINTLTQVGMGTWFSWKLSDQSEVHVFTANISAFALILFRSPTTSMVWLYIYLLKNNGNEANQSATKNYFTFHNTRPRKKLSISCLHIFFTQWNTE